MVFRVSILLDRFTPPSSVDKHYHPKACAFVWVWIEDGKKHVRVIQATPAHVCVAWAIFKAAPQPSQAPTQTAEAM